MIDNSKWQMMILGTLLLCFSACGTDSETSDTSSPAPVSPVAFARPEIQSFVFGRDAAHPALGNKADDKGPVRTTEIVVAAGDRVELKPHGFLREQRTVAAPVTAREDHNVCTRTADVCTVTQPIYQRQCHPECHICFPQFCCDSVCHDVQVGERCVATEQHCIEQQNQWVETLTFSGLDAPTFIKDSNPMKTADLMLTGLALRFSFLDSSGTQQNVDCGLGQFKPDIDSEGFSFLLGKIEGCPVLFPEAANAQSTLSLINAMDAPIPYSQGRLVKTWDGHIREKPKDMTWLSRIDFLGTITVYAAPSN